MSNPLICYTFAYRVKGSPDRPRKNYPRISFTEDTLTDALAAFARFNRRYGNEFEIVDFGKGS